MNYWKILQKYTHKILSEILFSHELLFIANLFIKDKSVKIRNSLRFIWFVRYLWFDLSIFEKPFWEVFTKGAFLKAILHFLSFLGANFLLQGDLLGSLGWLDKFQTSSTKKSCRKNPK